MKYLVLLIFASISTKSLSCEMPKEYLELREQVADTMVKPYKDCLSMTKGAAHWKAVSNCIMDAQGEHASECDRKVSHGLYPNETINTEHCELLQYTFEQFETALQESTQIKQILKCKI